MDAKSTAVYVCGLLKLNQDILINLVCLLFRSFFQCDFASRCFYSHGHTNRYSQCAVMDPDIGFQRDRKSFWLISQLETGYSILPKTLSCGIYITVPMKDLKWLLTEFCLTW